MFVPPFVLPDLRLFFTCLAGIGLLFTGFRVVRFLYQQRKPARQGVLVTSRASSLLVLLCSWPLLTGAVFSFITLGGVSCFVGFYQAAPVPPASLTVVTPSDLVMLNARDGSVQRAHVLASNASSPTEAGGLVYFEVDGPGSEMTVHASRLSDGSQLWSTVFALTGRYQPPLVVADGMVYLWQAYQSSSKLYALRADDGSIAWNLPLQMVLQPQEQSLTAGAGLLIVAARDGSFSAWHATDGSVAWHIDGSAFPREAVIGTGSPYVLDQAVSVANQTVYFARGISPEKRDGTTVSSLLVALRASDGHYLWQRDFPEERSIGPIFRFGPHLYLEVYDDLYALNATDGALLWQRSGVWASAVVETGGVIYVSGSTYAGVTLEALHVGDGSQIWSHPFASSSRAGTPIVLQNVMFVSLGAKEAPLFGNVCPGRTEPPTAIFALNASDGSIYWRNPNVIGLLSVTGATEAFQTSWPYDL